MLRVFFLIAGSFLFFSLAAAAQNGRRSYTITAYYAGGPSKVNSVDPAQLTHIIFSFCHLKGSQLYVDNASDSLTIKRLVNLKKKNPGLKVLLSMGGWGGCKTCSDVFASAAGRKTFAESVKELSLYFKTDGIDLDWEYPSVEGPPGHKYTPEDKPHFTLLLKQLRETLGNNYEITFAAGAFQKCLEESIDWPEAMKYADRVNLMTYDLVNGYSTVTGHHTALYSTPLLTESVDNAVQYLIKQGVPENQIVIGAAFYARIWEHVSGTNNGLYQGGDFKKSIPYKSLSSFLSASGFTQYWDDTAEAPYAYSSDEKLFATYDNKHSVKLKTQYVVDHKLNGIMFWQVLHDAADNGLIDTINEVLKENIRKDPK